jgi:hypothetical protein
VNLHAQSSLLTKGELTSALKLPKLELEEKITKFLNLIVETAFLGNPQSALLLGRAGSGKSHYLQPLEKLDFVFYTTDVTPSHITDFLNEVAYGRKRVLVIEDFTVISGMAQKTREALVHILKSGIEEGFSRIDHRGFEWKSPTGNRIKFALITSITTASYNDYSIAWKKNGFLSRLIPFSFRFSVATRETLVDETCRMIYRAAKEIDPKTFSTKIPLGVTKDSLNQFKIIADYLSKDLDSEPIRTLKQLNALAFANCALRGKDKVSKKDVEEIYKLSHWFNYDFHEI